MIAILATIDGTSLAIGMAIGVAGTLLAITIWRSRFAAVAPRVEALRATLRDVRKGGVVCLGAFGDEGDDLHLFVDSYARCERPAAGAATRDEWHELEGDYRGRRVGLEWRESDGGLRVVAWKRRRVAPDELKVDPAAVERAEKAPETTVEIDGVAYRLERSGEGLRHDGGHGMGIPLKTWDLSAPEQHGFVRVEREREGPIKASSGRVIAADAVEIFRVKAAE